MNGSFFFYPPLPPDLIYCGRKLKDDQTLDFYGIQPGSTVHVLRKSWPEPDQKPGECWLLDRQCF